VHHCGAGTTTTVTRAGAPQVVVAAALLLDAASRTMATELMREFLDYQRV
jgi:hypothetical protein